MAVKRISPLLAVASVELNKLLLANVVSLPRWNCPSVSPAGQSYTALLTYNRASLLGRIWKSTNSGLTVAAVLRILYL